MRDRSALVLVALLVCLLSTASSAYSFDDTPAGGGLHLRLASLTRGVVPNRPYVVRFSVNYSGPGNSGDIFLTFVATDGQARKLTPTIQAPGVRFRKPYSRGATSLLVKGVGSGATRIIRATFALRADGKICIRNSRAWLVENPSDYKARVGPLCNYTKSR
jgi:hypothetical protein